MDTIDHSIAELHRGFKKLNEKLFDGALPTPAILIQNQGRKKNVLGWCSGVEIWRELDGNELAPEGKYEITITAEYLNRGVLETMDTMLHEMCHLYNLVNGIKDTTRSNTYHNGKFKETAEMHGLVVEQDKKTGWSMTGFTPETKKLVESFKLSEEAFKMFRLPEESKGTKKSSMTKLTCKCGQAIRVTKPVNAICQDCGQKFKSEDE